MSELLDMYTIYARPSDWPGDAFVVRRAVIHRTGAITHDLHARGFETLDEARACIPLGRVRLDRFPDDDPVIVEAWI